MFEHLYEAPIDESDAEAEAAADRAAERMQFEADNRDANWE